MTDQQSALVSGEVNNSTLVMGPSGSGKTSLLATLAEYAWVTFGAVTFLYTSDGGGYTDHVAALIHKGIVKVFRMRSRSGGDDSLALETTIKSSKGWWPAQINPLTGMTDPNVPMVPPVIQDQTGQWRPNKGFPDKRVVMYDGLSSLSAWWVDDMQARAGRLEITGGEKGGGIGVIVSGSERFSGGSRSQVGFAQNRAHQFVMNTNGIPNLALPPVFTALTNEATDEASLRICGPKLAGQAKTDEAPQWFGNVLETRQVIDDKGNYVYRVYLTGFTENGIRHLCRNKAEAGVLPPFLQDPPPEADEQGHLHYPQAFTEFNLGKFFALMEAAHRRALERVDQDDRFKNAPGLPTVEYGEAPSGTPVVPTAATPPAAAPAPPAAAAAPIPTTLPTPAVPAAAAPAPAPVQPATPAAIPAPAQPAAPPPMPLAAPAPTAPAPHTTPAQPGPPAPAPTMRTVPPPPAGTPKPPAAAPATPVPTQ